MRQLTKSLRKFSIYLIIFKYLRAIIRAKSESRAKVNYFLLILSYLTYMIDINEFFIVFDKSL